MLVYFCDYDFVVIPLIIKGLGGEGRNAKVGQTYQYYIMITNLVHPPPLPRNEW